MSKKLVGPIMEFEINPHSLTEGLTQSEMQCWDNCAEKWYLGYNLMLTRMGKFSWALQYGSWLHASLEEFYSTKGKRWSWNPELQRKQVGFLSAEQLADQEYYRALGQIQMEVYASHYKGDFKFMEVEAVETQIDFEFMGVRLKGMIDLLAYLKPHKGFYVVDHKTAGRIDKQTVTGWDFRLQFMFYCWASIKMWPHLKGKIHGFFINAIKKPQLRRKVNESLQAFLQRVQTDMLQRPEEYFYRDRLRLKKEDIEHFEQKILMPKIMRVKMLRDPNIPPQIKALLVRNKNTDHCNHYGAPCEFINACKNGLDIERHLFKVREVKHQELAEETV